jgi:group I intron endonuclease
MKQKCYVYYLVNFDTGKFYVGSTSYIEERLRRHFNDLSNNRHHCSNLQDLYNKGFIFNTIVATLENVTRQTAFDMEQNVINLFCKTDLLLNIGLNVIGGDNLSRNPKRQEIINKINLTSIKSISKLSTEQRKKIYGRPGDKNPMYGKTHSLEARNKISVSHKGRKQPPTWKPNITEAMKKASSERMKKRLGSLNTFYGKTHSLESRKKMSDTIKSLNLKSVNACKVSIDGTIFDSFQKAGEMLNICSGTIRHRSLSNNPKFSNYFLI